MNKFLKQAEAWMIGVGQRFSCKKKEIGGSVTGIVLNTGCVARMKGKNYKILILHFRSLDKQWTFVEVVWEVRW